MPVERDGKGRPFFGRWEAGFQALILLNLIAFALETLPGLDGRSLRLLNGFEVFSTAVFAVEYVLRVSWSRPRLGYAFSLFGLVDLLAILPSILALGIDLRSLRILRLLRLIRILKLARYGTVIRRFERAFEIARDELAVFGAVALIFLYLAAVGIYHFEHEAQPEVFSSVFHSLWWATTTFTTVGYGDAYPVTPGGRLFTFVVLVLGLGIVAVPTGLIATALGKAREEEREAVAQKSPPSRKRRPKP
ncbi:MAG: ion transporter [Verrucomicrobia bacterium]|nr:ion transporter [Verrucomicrobiota bacterium]